MQKYKYSCLEEGGRGRRQMEKTQAEIEDEEAEAVFNHEGRQRDRRREACDMVRARHDLNEKLADNATNED